MTARGCALRACVSAALRLRRQAERATVRPHAASATHRVKAARAELAVHSTALGPAAGGVRFWHYADDARAVTDALRLSRGMSYKNAMAGLELGGGKGVVLAPAPIYTIVS